MKKGGDAASAAQAAPAAAQPKNVTVGAPGAEAARERVESPRKKGFMSPLRRGGDDGARRDRVIAERFHPEGVKYLKEVLGIDLHDVPLSDVYNLSDGRMTSPLESVVTPWVYDREARAKVAGEPIPVVASWRIVMPYDRSTYEPVAPDRTHMPFVAAYPCYEMLERAGRDGEAKEAAEPAEAAEEHAGAGRLGADYMKALENIGITSERMYPGGGAVVPASVKRDILDGRPFDAEGTVLVHDAVCGRYVGVNVSGTARLVMGDDGRLVREYSARQPQAQRSDLVPDLLKVRHVGNIDLDFFDRDAQGRVRTDAAGLPVINREGRDLLRYGQAFGPVVGYVTKDRRWDRESRSFVGKVQRGMYQVSLVNGGLCATPMTKVDDLDAAGAGERVVHRGERHYRYHYEVSNARVGRDGTVRIGSQSLRPATERDLEDYRRGRGGLFKGFEGTDEAGRKVKYDVFAVPDNRQNGFAKYFSPKVSQELAARREEVKKPARKQNYSLGL